MLHDPKRDKPRWEISHVPPKVLSAVWPQLQPMVERALKHGAGDTITELELIRGLAHGAMQLIVVHEGETIKAGMVLRVDQRARGLVVVVLLMVGAGHRDYAPRMQERLIDYAKLIGAYSLESIVRDGVVPIVEALGWKRKATMMEYPIDGRSISTPSH